MSGKFINTEYNETISNIVEGAKQRLDNPYYRFSDKNSTLVDYYNTDKNKSSIDEGSKDIYSYTGTKSPLVFNIIRDMALFGLPTITVDTSDIGDFGMESTDITGEAYILPNTIKPIAGDFFVIKHLTRDLLFKVQSTTIDTLENGANAYKIQYELDKLESIDILKDQIAGEYKFLINNVGGTLNPVIEVASYDKAKELDTFLSRFKLYYANLFFVDYLQTFIYEYNGSLFYDPYLIEFLIRNKIMSGCEKSIFVAHQTSLDSLFAIDYDNTFFKSIETKKSKSNYPEMIGLQVNDITSLMYMRYEPYFKISFATANIPTERIPTVNPDLIERIKTNSYYLAEEELSFYNIIIAYINNQEITDQLKDSIKNIRLSKNIDIFYAMPIIIYIIESFIIELLK